METQDKDILSNDKEPKDKDIVANTEDSAETDAKPHVADISSTKDNVEQNNLSVEQSLAILQDNYTKLQERYEQLETSYNTVNTKFLSFTQAYNALVKRNEEMKEEMEQFKQDQKDGAKIEAVNVLFTLHNNIKTMISMDQENMILKMLMADIENIFGVWQIELITPNVGDAFDPKVCRIIASENSDDESNSNKIAKLISVGYKMKSRLIKAAEVVVFV